MGEKRDVFSGIPKDSIVINTGNVSERTFEKYLSLITNRNNWHGFVIHNVKNPCRNIILKIVLDYVYPEALLPIMFQSKGTDCIFLSRNCPGAIDILLKNKLIIPDPFDKTLNYSCDIILMYSTITKLPLPPNNISKVLSGLYEENTKILNLEKFCDNKELSEYTPLSQPKLLCFALHLSNELKPQHIKLQNNEIRTLSPFEILREIGTVRRLDLRNNLINDMEELKYLKIFDLVELWLDGNPVCEKYNKFSYIKVVKNLLPMVKILDGICIDTIPLSEQFFICNDEGYDLVDQFIKHFFSLYDTDRKLLVDLYHISAIYTMTIEDSKGYDRLHLYRRLSKSIMHSNYSSGTVTIGNRNILSILCQLPETKHIMQDFAVDLIHYTDTSAVISVTGTFFQDPKQKLSSKYLCSFKRTFTLTKLLSEYVICNEITYIGNASDISTSLISKYPETMPECLKQNEKQFAIEAALKLTGLNKTWIERLLEDAGFDMIPFLTTLMNLLKGNKIPEQAYFGNEITLMEWLAPKMIQFGIEKFECSLQKEALEYIGKSSSLQKLSTLHTQSTASNIATKQKIFRKNNLKSNLIEINSSNVPKIQTDNGNMKTISTKSNESENDATCSMQNNSGQETSKKATDEVMKQECVQNESSAEITPLMPDKYTKENISENVRFSKSENLIVYPINVKINPTKQLNIPIGNTNYVNRETKPVAKRNNESEIFENEIYEFEIRPILALVDSKWINIQDHMEYDFELVFNKWILVQKGRDGKYSPKQDDFQKNFSCWKKHFPTYPGEILAHILNSSCLHSKFKLKFQSIQFPVTHWDFPASVPHDIRPPKSAELNENVKKFVTRGCGYGFVYVVKKWVLVTKNHSGQWVTRNNMVKVVWNGEKWVKEFLAEEEKAAGLLLPNRVNNDTSDSAQEDTKSEKSDDLLICDDEDLEIPSDDSDLTEKLQLEDLKTTYAEDVEPELTITTSDLEFTFMVGKTDTETKCSTAENLNKWKKLFKLVPYTPKLALIRGRWIVVDGQSDLKFHKTEKNEWILLKKNPQLQIWSRLNDDFFEISNGRSRTIEKIIFNHIPIPVTMYDFPDSVPAHLRPPKTFYIRGEEVEMTPDSGYAFVSVGTRWIPVEKNKQNEWKAVRPRHEADVERALANTVSTEKNETSSDIECEENEKILSAKCSLLQLIVGCKQVKPLTYWDIGGPESKRPPKLAITNMSGNQRWSCVSPTCGKGFVLEDGVWVKVVSSESGEWKGTQFDALKGCLVGYCLYGNQWVVMKKYIIGGKWAPMYNPETSPTTYWNYIGPDEKKPPQQVCIDGTYRTIDNNTSMGFLMRQNAWILVETEKDTLKGNLWKIYKNNNHFHICKLVHGIWRTIKEDSEGRWFYEPVQQKIFTYMNFIGLNTFAPPKQVYVLRGQERIRKTIDDKSGMGFVLNEGVWVIVRSKDGNLVPMKNLQGHDNFGFRRVGEKFVIVRKDDQGKWVQPNIGLYEKELGHCKVEERLFKHFFPITYDNILISVLECLKPPKYALTKDFSKNKECWRLIKQDSGYGFMRENDDTWLLLKWTFNGNWTEPTDETEYRYKIVNNMWLPVKYENNEWVPALDPKMTLKIPELCVYPPEKYLPNSVSINSDDSKSKYNVSPLNNLGYLKISNEYVLVSKTPNGTLVWPNDTSGNVAFKANEKNEWLMCEPSISSIPLESKEEIKKDVDITEIKTYGNTEGSDLKRPPRYIKVSEKGTLKWKEIDTSIGFGFIKKEYWVLVQKDGDNWSIVDENEGYAIIDNRWVPMKKNCDEWSPAFDPFSTPRTALDSIGDNVPPVRVASYRSNPKRKLYLYINTANDCSYGFRVEKKNVYILAKLSDSKFITMKDNFPEFKVMAYKLIDCKWRRMKKIDNDWVMCNSQINLPVLHIDLIGEGCPKPPSHISIPLADQVYEMSFNVFSEGGFELDGDCWILKQATKNGFDKYPGIYGNYGFKIIDGKTSVFKKYEGVWTPLIPVDLSVAILASNPVTYKNFEHWDEELKPPTDMLLLLHNEHLLGARECTCPYGFVKYKGVWVVVKKMGRKWEIQRKPDMCYGYKLEENRWVTMRLENNEWRPLHSSIPKAQKYLDTFGKFEDKPPLRAYAGNGKWRVILDEDPSGFIKENDMWVHVKKSKSNLNWAPLRFDGYEKIGYKIIDGRWTCFTKTLEGWKKFSSPHLTFLSCDFSPGHKSAPPNSLKFAYPPNLKHFDVGPSSSKGFILENGAWVLMEKNKKKWVRFESLPWIHKTRAFMLRNGVWKIVHKDLDGSWRPISLGFSKWIYDQTPAHLKKIPMSFDKMKKLHPSQQPPLEIVLFENNIPQKVSLKSAIVRNHYGLERHDNVWVLLKSTSKCQWDIAGTLVAYKMIEKRWVNMKYLYKWVPLYDPIKTPTTYFEVVGLKSPPLRVAINENGLDKWKVIFQNSGYGFTLENDFYVLMEKQCDGSWIRHRDHLLEFTGYKMINEKWTRFKKNETNAWTLKESSLPCLRSDFSNLHKPLPPPYLNIDYLMNPHDEQLKDFIIDLDTYAKFGFEQYEDVWVLMECDSDRWRKYKFSPNQTDCFGYRFHDGYWTLVKQLEKGWVEGKFEFDSDYTTFVELAGEQSHKLVEFNEEKICQSEKKTEISNILIEKDEVQNVTLKLESYKCESEIKVKMEETTSNIRIKMETKEGTSSQDTKNDCTIIKEHSEVSVMEILHNSVQNAKDIETVIEGEPYSQEVNEKTDNQESVEKNEQIVCKLDKEINRKKDENVVEEENTGKNERIDLETEQKSKNVEEDTIDSKMKHQSIEQKRADEEIENESEVADKRIDPESTVEAEQVLCIPSEGIIAKKDENLIEEEKDQKEIDLETEHETNSVEEKMGDSEIKHLSTKRKREEEENEPESRKVDEKIDYPETNVVEKMEDLEIKQQGIKRLKENDEKIDYQEKITKTEQVTSTPVLEMNVEIAENVTQAEEKEKENDQKTEQGGIHVNEEIADSEIEHQGTNRKTQDSEKEYKIIEEKDKASDIEAIDAAEKVMTISCGDDAQNEKDNILKKTEIVSEEIEKGTPDTVKDGSQDVNRTKQIIGDESEKNGCAGNIDECEDSVEKKAEKKPYEIPITSPVCYHQLAELPIEERPPKSVCLNIRGMPKRIPLVSKTSKIGFQLHKGVWVLLEKLSGVWKILHNSSGNPLAYKLIDNRWVSMRLDGSGFWTPTFNPVTTPRTYFELEGPDDTKPPRRILLEDNNILVWKEVSETSGFGFFKKRDFWILMKKLPNNRWALYRNSCGSKCGFKVQDSKWTRWTKKLGENWKIKDEDLPVIHYDYIDDSVLAPPVLTESIQKKIGKDLTKLGFLKDSAAWVLMEKDEGSSWTRVPNGEILYGFVRSPGALWDVVVKEKDQWMTVKSNCKFETAFDHIFKKSVDSDLDTPRKRLKIDASSTSCSEKCYEDKSASSDKNDENLSTQMKETTSLTKSPVSVNEQTVEPEKTPIASTSSDVPQDEELNSVEKYLALKPNCCAGCPELQALLLQFRPANNTRGRLRKIFRLPDGGIRRFQIPKAKNEDRSASTDKNDENLPKKETAFLPKSPVSITEQTVKTSTNKTTAENESATLSVDECQPDKNIITSLADNVSNSSTLPREKTNDISSEETPIDSTSSDVPQEEELNAVEKYLALRPNCCTGCPELQALLLQFRPADNPKGDIRKRFRLPNGGSRRLTIPRTKTFVRTSKKSQEISKKRKPTPAEGAVEKKRRIDE